MGWIGLEIYPSTEDEARENMRRMDGRKIDRDDEAIEDEERDNLMEIFCKNHSTKCVLL